MAETTDVYISGYDPSLPDWALEATQKQIASALTQANVGSTHMLKFLKAISNSEKVSVSELSKAVNELKQLKSKVDESTKATERATQKDDAQDRKTSSFFERLISLQTKQNMYDKQLLDETKKKADQRKLEAGFTQEDLGTQASLDRMKELGSGFQKVAAASAVASAGIESAFRQGFMDRFDMVQEMRQSGLLAGMDEASAGFINMSKNITDANFTFGEAAEFTKRFSQAVGVTGVQSALEFANAVAIGDEGFMAKLGLEFGQVANMSGMYLESLRIAGQLNGRSEQQLRSGMNDFMSNVQSTANVLKISVEEAAEIMMKTLDTSDTGLLATMNQDQARTIENALRSFGSQGGPLMEALSARLTAGDQGTFLRTEQFAGLQGTALGQEMLPFIEQMATIVESGGDFQGFLANNMGDMAERVRDLASQAGVREQLVDSPELASLVGALLQQAQTIEDAAKGMPQLDEAGRTGLVKEELDRQAIIASEDVVTQSMDDFVNNMAILNVRQANLIDQARKSFTNLSEVTDIINNFGTALSVITTFATEMGLKLVDFGLNEDEFAGLNNALNIQTGGELPTTNNNNSNPTLTPNDMVSQAAETLSNRVNTPFTVTESLNFEGLESSIKQNQQLMLALEELIKQNQQEATSRMESAPAGSETRAIETENVAEYNILLSKIGELITELQR